MQSTEKGRGRKKGQDEGRQGQKGYQFSSSSWSSLVTLMSSAGTEPSRRHPTEIDTCIYVHFLVTIFTVTVQRSIRSFEFVIDVDEISRTVCFTFSHRMLQTPMNKD
jgi:hypothetical protein